LEIQLSSPLSCRQSTFVIFNERALRTGTKKQFKEKSVWSSRITALTLCIRDILEATIIESITRSISVNIPRIL